MPGDLKPPTDAKLSDADVKRVLERAVRIDASQSAVSISDLTQAAHEAGISEQAVMQAVREVLDPDMMTTAGSASSTSGQVGSRIRSCVRKATYGLLVVIALMAIFVLMRLTP